MLFAALRKTEAGALVAIIFRQRDINDLRVSVILRVALGQ
jgi:hypothetical protein